MTKQENITISLLTATIESLVNQVQTLESKVDYLTTELNSTKVASPKANSPKKSAKKAEVEVVDYGTPHMELVGERGITPRNGNGSFIKHKVIRGILNERIKSVGGQYNKTTKAYMFNTKKSALDAIKSLDCIVTEAQIANYVARFN